jgi:Ras-related protein Rab-5C
MKNGSYKMLLLGESTVGKTSIALRFRKEQFNSHFKSTIGVSYASVTIDETRYELWDTAGQERFNSMVPLYFVNANIAMLVYDVTKLSTVTRLKKYISILQEKTPGCHMIIIGNKCDLPEVQGQLDNIMIEVKNILTDEEKIYNLEYFMISAKTNQNVDKLMSHISNIHKKKSVQRKDDNDQKLDNSVIDLNKPRSDMTEFNEEDQRWLTGYFSSYCNIL